MVFFLEKHKKIASSPFADEMVAEPHTHPETQFFDESYSRYYDETSNLLPAQESPATKDRNITRLRKALPWLIHITLFCSYILLAVRAKAKSAQCFDGKVSADTSLSRR